VIDLLTKHWIFQWRGIPPEKGLPREIRPIWEDYVGIETALNKGGLFGMLQGYVVLFSCLSVVAVVGIVCWLFLARAARDRFLTVTLGCVTGGILGNLYDRFGLWGHPDLQGARRCEVRDWILLRAGDFEWPNFNVADCLLVTGAILLAWHALFLHGKKPSGETDKT